MSIILYSTGCPLCKKLVKKLEEANIYFEINTDENRMKALGFEYVPILAVDDQYLEFGDAVKWIKERQNEN